MNRAARLLALLLCASACAHAPPPAVEVASRSWPAPPARPLARFVESFPRPDAEPERAPFWKRVLTLIVGLEPESHRRGPLLERPFGIAALEHGFVVADPDGRAVLRVEPREGRSTPLECAGRPWKMPLAVASAPDGSIYVADGAAGLVLRLAVGGGCTAIGAGVLERPSGLAFVAGRIYAVDPPRHQVVAFEPDGREALRFGTRGEGSGQLNFPTGLGAGGGDTLLVVDALNFRVVRYQLDGTVVGSFGGAGDGGGAFGRPKGVVSDGAGRIFLSDAQNDVVIVFSRAGGFEVALGGSGTLPGSLTLPAGVAVGDGFLYVADSYNHRVQIFQLLDSEDP